MGNDQIYVTSNRTLSGGPHRISGVKRWPLHAFMIAKIEKFKWLDINHLRANNLDMLLWAQIEFFGQSQ